MLNCKNYIHDVRGNFSIMLGLGLSVIVLGSAAAIETGNMTRVKNTLQSQVDIATLAAAGTPTTRNEGKLDYESLVYDVMIENGYDPTFGKPAVKLNGNYLNVSTQVPYEGYFTQILGNSELKISVDAQSTLPSLQLIEMVLVLDNTASMTVDGKMEALVTGASNIIEVIKKSNSGSKIGMVPFARYINIGDASGSWLDKPAEYDTNREWQQAIRTGGTCRTEKRVSKVDGVDVERDTEICDGQTITYETKTNLFESRFEGCIGTSDEPDHLAPISSSNRVPGLLNKHVKEVTGLGRDVVADCPLPIRPLDDDYTDMIKFVNGMFGTDVTYIPSGLLWGERMLDRTKAFKQEEKTDGVRQIMVLMTDGKNTAEVRSGIEYEENYRAPPYVYTDTHADTPVPKANSDTSMLCDRIKGKNIELFTISFRVDDAEAKTLVKDCATSESHAFEAESNDSLIDAFDEIGSRLSSNVRLTR